MTLCASLRICFAIVLTVISTNVAKNIPEETNQHLLDKYSIVQSDVEASKSKSSISSINRKKRSDSPDDPVVGVPFVTSTFETRTEILPLKDGHFTRYHLTETSLPFSQYSNNDYIAIQEQGNIPNDAHTKLFDRQKVTKKDTNENFKENSNIAHLLKKNIKPLQDDVSNLSNLSSKEYQHETTPELFGLSYLSAEEAKDLLKDPSQNSNYNIPRGLKSPLTYQSDSPMANSFPRFNIPLKSLLLDSMQITNYNTETSEIIDPTFIVPEGKDVQIPQPSSQKTTYGVSISDEKSSRKEIRKDNAEFFSSFRGSDITSANVGSLVPTADGDQVLVLKGSYSFTSPEGLRFRVDYTADETGYHATQVPVSPD